jgi:LacI family transcriptional regulator
MSGRFSREAISRSSCECPISEGVAVHRRARATLVDVARVAGVSTTTASYVLNDRNDMRISDEAGRRVREAAVTLGYRPNRNALNLRTARTMTVGLISDYLASGHFASRMLSGASAAARTIDHLLVIGESEGDADVETELIAEMLDREVDGILYATLVTSRITLPAGLRDHRVVLLNCVAEDHSVPAVVPDEVDGGRRAARALLEAGHGDGVFVVGEEPEPDALAGPARLAGIRECLMQEGGVELAGVLPCAWAVVPAFEAVSKWLATGARPAALVCLNDRIAMGAYQALDDAGLHVPADVSVVSFDASELASWLNPALTSVAVPYAELGAQAVRMLMSDDVRAGTVVEVPMPVQHGGSVARL